MYKWYSLLSPRFQVLARAVAALLVLAPATTADCPACDVRESGKAVCTVSDSSAAVDCLGGDVTSLTVTGSAPPRRLDATFFGNATHLGDVTFFHVGIAELDASTFHGLTGLRDLSLVKVGLDHLPRDLLARAPNLTRFWTSFCKTLTSLPEDLFARNPALRWLDLSGNGLLALPAGLLRDKGSLSWLDVGGNSLTELPRGLLDGCANLSRVDVSRNRLSSLPQGLFRRNPRLSAVNLSGNGFSSLAPETFPVSQYVGLVFLEDNKPPPCDCGWGRNVTRLSGMGWDVQLPGGCEATTKENCDKGSSP